MKKKLVVTSMLFLMIIQMAFAVVPTDKPVTPTIDENVVNIGHGVKVSVDKALTITPKEYRQLTGHRLGFVKSIVLKKIQKKLIKHLNSASPVEGGNKSQVVAALLCFFLGGLGIHRFYLGYTWQGIVQILTLGGLGVWALIDFVRILIGDLEPKNGSYN